MSIGKVYMMRYKPHMEVRALPVLYFKKGKLKGVNMNYDKKKLLDLIDRLNVIQEYDYITYPNEDNEKVKVILSIIENEIEKWEKMQNDNYSY